MLNRKLKVEKQGNLLSKNSVWNVEKLDDYLIKMKDEESNKKWTTKSLIITIC